MSLAADAGAVRLRGKGAVSRLEFLVSRQKQQARLAHPPTPAIPLRLLGGLCFPDSAAHASSAG
jgi:hypothetical protein